ncbi:MAG: glycosyltransferase [Sphingomonadales bacterium]
MLRVLTLSTLFPDASRPTFGPFVERQTLGLAAHPDVELRVMAPVGIPPLGRFHSRYRQLARLPDVETWKGLAVYRTPFGHIPGVGGKWDAGALTRALRRPLEGIRAQFPFDVIDAQFFWPDGPAAVALGKHFNVPVSIKARGADIHFWGCNPATRGAVAQAGRGADGLLAVSAALKADMVALGMPADRITVHHTGIDRDVFHVRDRESAKAALGIDGPLIVSVGALIARKGQAYVIDAMPLLPKATLVLIGSGEDAAPLKAQAERSGVADRVRFMGSLPQVVIADWLAAADVMALPSASEGLANAWVEALASGTPVVTCDVGGARELVDRPAAGRLVPRDAGMIAAVISDLIANPPEREAVAAAVEAFSWEANTAALYAHLSGLAARHPGVGRSDAITGVTPH